MSLIFKLINDQKIQKNNIYLENVMKREGAIASLERVKKYGVTESGNNILWSKWFEQQIRLTADKRLRHVITTGASQISKSLGNYLVAIDDLVNGQINIAWIYPSRTSMQNQQPSQFQAMITGWLQNQNVDYLIKRDAISRYKIGRAIGNFAYANGNSQNKNGGAAEGVEQTSFQASVMYLEEKSSHGDVDLSPRLGASVILSKPIRELGTPGNGAGIERSLKECEHIFTPGIKCDHCGKNSRLHPLGNLFKKDLSTNSYFNSRGHIIDYFKNKFGDPIIVCNHCGYEISDRLSDPTAIKFFSDQTGIDIDDFLDNLPDKIYYPSVGIYLSPLLRCVTDPFRIRDLVEEGKEPESVLIFHQNKLGVESKFTLNGIGFDDYERALDSPWHFQKNEKTKRYVGIDQGTDNHYLVDLEVYQDRVNVKCAIAIKESEILAYLKYNNIDFGIIDGEPGRMSANVLSKQSKGKLAIADQRQISTDYASIKVSYGGEEIDCYAINNTLYHEKVIYDFIEGKVRIAGSLHPKFKKHITSIKRDLTTGKFIRPGNHDDDFFFAYLFARSAIDIMPKSHVSISSNVGKPLKQLMSFKSK